MTRLQKIFWFSLLIKIVVGAIVPLTSDEAYYLAWSHRLQWSYFDHPAMISWLYWLAHPVEHVLSLARLPGLLLTHATLYIWLKILRPWLTETQRELWLWLALLSPLLGGSAFVVTPDVPLMFFWAVALFVFFHWTQHPTWRISLLLGLSMGLGFSSKYMMVLFPLSLLPVVAMVPSFRRSFWRGLPWIFLGGLIGIAPVMYWNLVNDFQSIRFQVAHGIGRPQWKPNWTWEYVLVQIAVIFPIIFYFSVTGIKRAAPIWRYLSFVPLVFFLFTSYRGYVEANWPIVAYPSLFYLAILGSHGREHLLKITAAFWALLFATIFIFSLKPEWNPIKNSKLRDFYQFDQASHMTQALSPLYARSYQMAATLEHRQRRPVYKLPGLNRRDFYDSLPEAVPTAEKFFVVAEKTDRLPARYVEQGYRILHEQVLDENLEIWHVERKQ